MTNKSIYDIAIIGAGCVGCAVAQRLSKYQLNVVILEKESDVSQGASKANSGIIHTGYFTKEGSMKEKMNLRGYRMFDEVCSKIGVDLDRNGALFCAINEKENHILEQEFGKSKARGVNVEFVTDKEKIHELEPLLLDTICSVLHYPDAGIIVPFELVIGLAEHAVMNDVELKLDWEVAFIKKKGDIFHIHSKENEHLHAKTIINAAGIYSDKIAQMFGINDYHIVPRRGEYVLFDRDSMPLKKILFPAPTPESKGIVISPTVHKNFYIGPNAHEVDSKDNRNTSAEGLNEIIANGAKLVGELPLKATITNFAGLRATERYIHDFVIQIDAPQFINAVGIESPGLSSCLAIAEYIESLVKECGHELIKKVNYQPTRKRRVTLLELSDEELAEKINQNPQWGNMICRCETVTEAEIVNACHAPIPCTNLDMVKRRLRAGMGRCQGGFCRPKVMKIISRERNMMYEEVTKKGGNSKVVIGRTKRLTSKIYEMGDEL